MAAESLRGWRVQASALADELRGVIEALSTRALTSEQLAEATQLACSLRERLGGAVRPRWYDADEDAMTMGASSRSAYLDQSPIRGRLNPLAPPLAVEIVERPDGSRGVVGRARLGIAYEGPPHGVHGGWVAALFDDLLGATQGLAEAPGMTAILKVRYRHVTPIEEDLRFEGWIHEVRGRRIVARATCHAGDTLTADAEALFVGVDFNEIQERMRERRPA